jgi:hypothetical protein
MRRLRKTNYLNCWFIVCFIFTIIFYQQPGYAKTAQSGGAVKPGSTIDRLENYPLPYTIDRAEGTTTPDTLTPRMAAYSAAL